MSTSEHLFFDPGTITRSVVVRAIAERLAGELVENSESVAVIVRGSTPSDSVLIARVDENDYLADDPDPSEPTDRTVFDDLPLLLRMNLVPIADLDAQASAARAVFDRLAEPELGWPLVLVHEFEVLVATYDVDRGVREFPPGTRSDGTDEHLWR